VGAGKHTTADKPRGASGLIELPFPPASLSPNARLHWRALDRAKKQYKADCAWLLFQTPVPELGDGRIPLTITISPPDRRRRDRDNMQSAIKYGLDTLAVHWGVDDYLFDPSYRFAEPVKGGRVVIEVGA
jgi:crossover junction endodeoxyribonuclease RusA